MATLYGHGKGKAGSHKPINLKPDWVKIEPKEAEKIILELSQKGASESKIGLILRDTYGIPSIKALTGKSLRQILKENSSEKAKQLPEDIFNLIKNLKKLRKHFENNKKDMVAKRGIQLTEAKIRRLQNYYKDRNILPKDFDFREINV